MNQLVKWSFILSVGIIFISCKEDNKPEFDREAMLTNMASNIIIPGYQSLKSNLEVLKSEIINFNGNQTIVNLNNVKGAYINANVRYQELSMFNFGPAFDYDIKKSFNTYPCDTGIIESNIASGSYNLGALSNALAIGFPAIDFLLYHESESNTISSFNALNRQQYLLDLVNKMIIEIDLVLSAWNGSYKTTFIQASGNDVASSCSYLLNEMVIDIELIKNAKIGIPSGQSTGGATLPSYVEGYYSNNSLLFCKENLWGLKKCFNGGTGIGFDDYVRDVEGEDVSTSLADNINTQFDICVSKVDAITNPLSAAVNSNPTAVNELYLEIKKLVIYCKTDLTAKLGILITYQDNDGD